MADQPAQPSPPPPLLMMQLLFGKQLTYSLSGVARLGIADHMSGEPQPVEAIAAKAGAHAPSLYRVMRMLAGFGVFKERPRRHFALTPVRPVAASSTVAWDLSVAHRGGVPASCRSAGRTSG